MGKDMEKGRVRIVDIAEELGLSTATVSNVLHGKTKKISDETIRRVQEKIEERGYIPDMAAILLARNNSRIIGVVINHHEKYENRVLEDMFIAQALNALSEELNSAGYFMMVKTTSDCGEIVRIASMWNMEGMVLIGFCGQDYVKLRASMHIPFVIYDGYFDEKNRAGENASRGNVCNLRIDDFDGGRQVGEYLRRMGHRKVLCIADNYICMDKERIDGCREGMSEGQTDLLMVPMEREQRKRLYREKLGEIREYTAVFLVSDYYAAELLRYLTEWGVSVPEEISVVGFDDSPWCEMVHPHLTTVRQDSRERAKQAVAILQRLKEGRMDKDEVRFSVRLVERDSVWRLTQGV